MERQLDPDGGSYLHGKMEELGIRCCSAARPRRLLGNGHVEGVALRRRRACSKPISSSSPPASGPTSSWRARPASTSTAASSSTTTWRRRDPDIFAVGECVEHRRRLLRPGRAALRAGQGAGGDDHRQQGPDLHRHRRRPPSSRSWASTSSPPATGATQTTPSRCATRIRALGIYKKLTRARRQAGGRDPRRRHLRQPPLHGLAAHRRPTSPTQRRHLLFPPPAADAGLDVAEMPDSATVCGCVGVTKGAIIAAIHEHGRQHAVAAEGVHARQHRLRQLHGALPGPAAAVAPEFEEETQEGALRLRAVLRRTSCARSCAASG